MMRKPYILKSDEIDALLAGMIAHGESDTYDRMRDKAFLSSETRADMDDIFLDMYDGMIKKARLAYDDGEDEQDMIDAMYSIAFMMRDIAHKLYRKYLRSGLPRDSDRFIRLVSDKG